MQRSVNVFVCTCACACVLEKPEDTQTPTILLIAYFYERSYKILFFNIFILKTASWNSLICLRYLGSFLVFFFFFKFSYRLCNVINTFFNLCLINLNIIFLCKFLSNYLENLTQVTSRNTAGKKKDRPH